MWCCPIYHWGFWEMRTKATKTVWSRIWGSSNSCFKYLIENCFCWSRQSIALQLLLMFPYLKIEPLCGTLEWSFKKVKVANSSHDFLDALIKASSIKMHQELLLQLTTYSTKNSISQREALSCKRTTTMLLLFTTDWIFFRPFSLCVNEAPASFEAFLYPTLYAGSDQCITKAAAPNAVEATPTTIW